MAYKIILKNHQKMILKHYLPIIYIYIYIIYLHVYRLRQFKRLCLYTINFHRDIYAFSLCSSRAQYCIVSLSIRVLLLVRNIFCNIMVNETEVYIDYTISLFET